MKTRVVIAGILPENVKTEKPDVLKPDQFLGDYLTSIYSGLFRLQIVL